MFILLCWSLEIRRVRDGVSPSQKLLARRMRAHLPMTKELLKPQVVDGNKVMAGAERAKRKQKENYDVKACLLSPLEVGEFVRVKLPGKQTWSLAKCVKQVGPRSYEVMCGERIYRRNRRNLRKTVETYQRYRRNAFKVPVQSNTASGCKKICFEV